MQHIGVIGIPGAWSSEMIKTAFEKKYADEVAVDVFLVEDLVFDVQQNKVFFNEKDIETYDCIIIKKLGAYAPRILDWLDVLSNIEDKGLRFFSSPKKLRKMISRIGCTAGLAEINAPMPKTIITENIASALTWIKQSNGAVFKPNFSTKARGMEVLLPSVVTSGKLEQLKQEYGMLYLQELVELPGKDFGVVFSGEKYLGTYARVGSKDSWNTTTTDGGHYESYTPSPEILTIAQKARDFFNLDFCCVDIAETPNGPIVFEVSAFGGFKGMYKGVGINSAEVLVEYISDSIF